MGLILYIRSLRELCFSYITVKNVDKMERGAQRGDVRTGTGKTDIIGIRGKRIAVEDIFPQDREIRLKIPGQGSAE